MLALSGALAVTLLVSIYVVVHLWKTYKAKATAPPPPDAGKTTRKPGGDLDEPFVHLQRLTNQSDQKSGSR